jgi:plasmid stability protein
MLEGLWKQIAMPPSSRATCHDPLNQAGRRQLEHRRRKRSRGSEADRPALMAIASMQTEGTMGGNTIRTLDGSLKSRRRIQAAVHGRSMEHEARDILRCVLNQQPQGPRDLGTAIHDVFQPFGGFAMPEVPRDRMREPPRFDGCGPVTVR